MFSITSYLLALHTGPFRYSLISLMSRVKEMMDISLPSENTDGIVQAENFNYFFMQQRLVFQLCLCQTRETNLTYVYIWFLFVRSSIRESTYLSEKKSLASCGTSDSGVYENTVWIQYGVIFVT